MVTNTIKVSLLMMVHRSYALKNRIDSLFSRAYIMFAALVLAQIVSEKSINAFLFTFGLIVLVVTVIIGLSISTNKDNK